LDPPAHRQRYGPPLTAEHSGRTIDDDFSSLQVGGSKAAK
jgi:hypothetical protein